jgi:site-specific DNA-methyltransferase (adenine-specific)
LTITILQGDVVEQLKTLPGCSVQCVVTSPPYYGLRNYGVDGQIGLEDTPEQFVAKIVGVFREVRRVLRDDGTLWLNFGDSYAGHSGNTHCPELTGSKQQSNVGAGSVERITLGNGLKTKDLIGIPWMVAFALRADGWYLRSDIIWNKPNPMPESVTDRPTKSHEYIFLLTKKAKYYYDADAIREPHVTQEDRPDGIIRNRLFEYDSKENLLRSRKFKDRDGFREGNGALYTNNNTFDNSYVPKNLQRQDPNTMYMARHRTNIPGHSGNYNAAGECILNHAGRNRRTVWEIATQPTPEAHFATFPEALVEPCIKAGTSERGCCSVCGSPMIRTVETTFVQEGATRNRGKIKGDVGESQAKSMTMGDGGKVGHNEVKTTGWQPSCSCNVDTVPCAVLDPFGGSGTTAKVARDLKRDCILIELNPAYVKIMKNKLRLNEQLVIP